MEEEEPATKQRRGRRAVRGPPRVSASWGGDSRKKANK